MEDVLIRPPDLHNGLVRDFRIAQCLARIGHRFAVAEGPPAAARTVTPFVEERHPIAVQNSTAAVPAAKTAALCVYTVSAPSPDVDVVPDRPARTLPVRHEVSGILVVGPEIFEAAKRRAAIALRRFLVPGVGPWTWRPGGTGGIGGKGEVLALDEHRARFVPLHYRIFLRTVPGCPADVLDGLGDTLHLLLVDVDDVALIFI